jgi:histo-blood group ABO system transferase
MKIGLMTIATGKAYQEYAYDLFESANSFFPEADQIVFTDSPSAFRLKTNAIYVDEMGYPEATLFRYRTFLSKSWFLSSYDYLFYADADMQFVRPVENIIYSDLVATLHPGYYKQKGTPETRSISTACCPDNRAYYCGGFQGGSAERYLEAARVMAANIEEDERNKVLAVWHDESHWNRYLRDVPPTQVLTPSYCYPEDYSGGYMWEPSDFPPILVALDKRKRGNHPRFQ